MERSLEWIRSPPGSFFRPEPIPYPAGTLFVLFPILSPPGREFQAVDYTLRLWDQLVCYTQDGRVEIDNNLVENAIRPTAVGKKNWLFFGSENAGWQSAVLFSILETCRKLEINPQEYLLDVLTRLPHMTNRQVCDLTPSKWLQARMKIAC